MKAAAVVVAVATFITVLFVVFTLLHMLWCFVLPKVWPDGPADLVQPDFWLFVGAWLLAGFIGRNVFGRTGGKD